MRAKQLVIGGALIIVIGAAGCSDEDGTQSAPMASAAEGQAALDPVQKQLRSLEAYSARLDRTLLDLASQRDKMWGCDQISRRERGDYYHGQHSVLRAWMTIAQPLLELVVMDVIRAEVETASECHRKGNSPCALTTEAVDDWKAGLRARVQMHRAQLDLHVDQIREIGVAPNVMALALVIGGQDRVYEDWWYDANERISKGAFQEIARQRAEYLTTAPEVFRAKNDVLQEHIEALATQQYTNALAHVNQHAAASVANEVYVGWLYKLTVTTMPTMPTMPGERISNEGELLVASVVNAVAGLSAWTTTLAEQGAR